MNIECKYNLIDVHLTVCLQTQLASKNNVFLLFQS